MTIGTGKDLPHGSHHRHSECSEESSASDKHIPSASLDPSQSPSTMSSGPNGLRMTMVSTNCSFYEIDSIKLWGYDAVSPNEDWSPANFANMANVLIEDIWRRKKLPIIVGGDGFYLKVLTNPWQTLYIP